VNLPNKKIKIIEIVTRLNIGGPAINVIYITSLLDKNKFDITLITGKESRDEGNMFNLCAKMQVTPILIPELGRELNLKNDLIAFLKLLRLMVKYKPDIVHTHTAKAGTLGRLAAILTFRKMIIHTFHGHIFDGYFSPLKTKFFTLVERALSRFTDVIISVSNKQRKDFVGLKLGNYDKIINIPLGLELETFKESRKFRAEMRKTYQIPETVIVVSIVARIVPIKNHSLLITAARILIEKFKFNNFKIMVVGDGYLKNDIENQICDAGLIDYFIFVGFIDDLPKFYGMSDITALTSNNEGLPTVIIESMAASVPVIATDVGGVGDLVKDNETGLLVEPNNPELFARRLLELCVNPELRDRLAVTARQFAFDNYSIDVMTRNFMRLYSKISE